LFPDGDDGYVVQDEVIQFTEATPEVLDGLISEGEPLILNEVLIFGEGGTGVGLAPTASWTTPYIYNLPQGATLTESGVIQNLISSNSLAGVLTSGGTIIRQVGKVLAGVVTSGGVLVKAVAKAIAGGLTSAGALVKSLLKALAATLSDSGTVTKSVGKAVAGTLTSSGVTARAISKLMTAALSVLVGAIHTISGKLVGMGATLTLSGSNIKSLSRALTGIVTSSGLFAKQASKALSATMASAGTLARRGGKILGGLVTGSGALIVPRFVKTLSASLSFLGNVINAGTAFGSFVILGTIGWFEKTPFGKIFWDIHAGPENKVRKDINDS
jgi:hypothetical protein